MTITTNKNEKTPEPNKQTQYKTTTQKRQCMIQEKGNITTNTNDKHNRRKHNRGHNISQKTIQLNKDKTSQQNNNTRTQG